MRKSKNSKQSTINTLRKSYRNCSFQPLRSLRDSIRKPKILKKTTESENKKKDQIQKITKKDTNPIAPKSKKMQKRKIGQNPKRQRKSQVEKKKGSNTIFIGLRNSVGVCGERKGVKKLIVNEGGKKDGKKVKMGLFPSYRYFQKEKRSIFKKKEKSGLKSIRGSKLDDGLTGVRSRTMSSFWNDKEYEKTPEGPKNSKNFDVLGISKFTKKKNEKKIQNFIKKLRKSYKEKLSSLATLDSSNKRVGKKLQLKNQEKNKKKETSDEKKTNFHRKNIVLTSLQKILSRDTSTKRGKNRKMTHCKIYFFFSKIY